MKKYRFLTFLVTIIFVAVTAYLIYCAVDLSKIPADASGRGISVAAFLALGVIIIGGIGNGVVLLLSALGTLISAVGYRRGKVEFGTLLHFIMFMIFPIISEVVFLFIASSL